MSLELRDAFMANEKNWEVIRVQMIFKIMAWKG